MGGKTIAALAAGALALGGVGAAAVATEDTSTSNPSPTIQAQTAPHVEPASTGQYSATVHWAGVSEPGQTGYHVYQNGTQVADVPTPSYTFTGLDCGTTYTFGVAGHDNSGHTTPTSTTTYSTPACPGGGGGGPTVNYFVAQTTAGSGNGSSCATAAAVSTLATTTHWTAGNVIGLCGTITSTITAQASGTSGNPITVLWEPGATLSEPACPSTGCFNTNGKTFLTLNGGTNGSVQATANGSGLANQIAGNGIQASNCSNCTIENLTVANVYQHTSLSDTNGNAQSTGGIEISGSSNILVSNDTIHDTAIGIYDAPGSSDANITITANNIYNINWGMGLARQSSGGTIGPVYVYGNHMHDWGTWNTTADAFHHNGLYCFSGGGVSTLPHYTAIYVYNNVFDGTESTDSTAFVWPGGSPGGSQLTNPTCADATTPWYVFNNVFQPTGSTPGDAEIYPTCCTVHVYNNTLIGPGTGRLLFAQYGGTLDLRNNLFNNADTLIDMDTSAGATVVALSPAPDYNYYANGGSNAFVCNGFFSFTSSGFSSWKACSGGDSHGTADTSTFSLNPDGSLPSGNAAIGTATNLTSSCSGQPTPGLGALCSNVNGAARPASGAWNPGAF